MPAVSPPMARKVVAGLTQIQSAHVISAWTGPPVMKLRRNIACNDELKCKVYNLRKQNNITVPRFITYCLKNSLSHRGAILWNIVSNYYKVFFGEVKKDKLVRELNFNAESVQSLPRHFSHLKCYLAFTYTSCINKGYVMLLCYDQLRNSELFQ